MLQVLSLVLKNEEKPAKPQRAGILHCLMYNQAPSAPRTAGSSSVNEPGPPAAPLAEEKIIQSIIETQRGWAGRDLKAPAPAVGLSPPPPPPPDQAAQGPISWPWAPTDGAELSFGGFCPLVSLFPRSSPQWEGACWAHRSHPCLCWACPCLSQSCCAAGCWLCTGIKGSWKQRALWH